MGALHAGHLSLVERSVAECDVTVVTIFVNPAQFGPHEDFARYPRDLEADLALLTGRGVDFVFAPEAEAIYPPGFSTRLEVGGVSERWEGAVRPGHFAGVATVVLKLFQIAPAHVAYFGQKDYQQTCVVRKMVADLNLPIEIVVCPTVRESDGLAMSSRNAYLSPEERLRAVALSQSLKLAEEMIERGRQDVNEIVAAMRHVLEHADARIDYATLIDPDTLEELDEIRPPLVALVAARIGNTRLIDNLVIGANSHE
jgi:pantoate--beta-alanine ligase